MDQLSVMFLSLLQREVLGEQFIWLCFVLRATFSGRAAKESSNSASGAWDALEGRAGCRALGGLSWKGGSALLDRKASYILGIF